MAGTQFPDFNLQFFDRSGTRVFPADGYLLHQYESGTTTDQDTYSDRDLTILNTNPIVLSASGKCTMFADPELVYTFVLTTPEGVPIDTWDDISSFTLPVVGDFLPKSGGTMTGFITLHADGTSALHPVTKQQLEARLATALASVTALTDAATAAAAAATAAAAAVKPTNFILATASGSAAVRDYALEAGTYEVTLFTTAHKADGGGTYSINVTQSATVSSTSVNTSFDLNRVGGGGYGREIFGADISVGTLTLASAGTYSFSIAAAGLNTATSNGSMLFVQKIS